MTDSVALNSAPAEDAVAGKVIRRVLPLLVLMYFVAIVDKSNVGFAKLQMIDDLHIDERAYGFASSLFFLGLLIFEIPSSLLARRFGLRFWTTRIMLTWSAATLAMTLVSSAPMLQGLRFGLGIAEAGLYPAILYYLSCWFPSRHRARATGLFTLASALGNGFGAALSGPLLDLDGTLGLAGWQWLFIVTGCLPIIVAALVWRTLPNTIDDAVFLDAGEREVLHAAVLRDRPTAPAPGSLLAVFVHPRVLLLAGVFVTILTALMGVIYWTPTVVKAFKLPGTAVGLLSALPWAAVVLALLTVPPRLKTPRAIVRGMAVIAAAGCGLFLASVAAQDNLVRFICIVLGTPCISLLIACFWTIPVRYFHGLQAAAALAAISTYSNLGGFFAQNLMPWAAARYGAPVGAMVVPAVCLGLVAVGAAFVLLLGRKGPASPSHQGTANV